MPVLSWVMRLFFGCFIVAQLDLVLSQPDAQTELRAPG
jgi:hypothetical protein